MKNACLKNYTKGHLVNFLLEKEKFFLQGYFICPFQRDKAFYAAFCDPPRN